MATTVRTWQRVGWWRERGVAAKWGRAFGGRPVMLVQYAGRFHVLGKSEWETIAHRLDGGNSLTDAVASVWALADLFSIPMAESQVMA